MTWFEEANAQFAHKWAETARKELEKDLKSLKIKKEAHTMKVSYNGFTGELINLDRMSNGDIGGPVELPARPSNQWYYSLSIYDREKQVTHFFIGVKIEDVKFLGGAVSLCG